MHTITVSLGITDAHARVHDDGTVVLESDAGHPLPGVLVSAAWAVLGTWMLEQDNHGDGTTGSTMVPIDGWHELFDSRLEVLAA